MPPADSSPYPLSHYDGQFCLKPPMMMWLAILYLSRGVTLPLIIALGQFSGVDSRAADTVRELWSADELAPSAIAALVLYALWRRVPSASRGVRWIWSNGRVVLAVAAIVDLGMLLIGMGRIGEPTDQSIGLAAAGIVDAYFLAYVLAARRIRDTFAEFPTPLEITRR